MDKKVEKHPPEEIKHKEEGINGMKEIPDDMIISKSVESLPIAQICY